MAALRHLSHYTAALTQEINLYHQESTSTQSYRHQHHHLLNSIISTDDTYTAMSDYLLSLPGELRNRIYQFVLFEEHGLNYVEDNHGVGWLCLPNSRVEISDTEIIDTEINNTKHAESEPTPTATIKQHQISAGRYAIRNGHVIANQLQFVCRQLRCETKTLAIRYNAINFGDRYETTASKFLASLPPILHGAVKVLNVFPRGPRDEPGIPSAITKFCRDQPKCVVRLYHPMIASTHAVRLLFTAFLVKHEMRGDKTFAYKLSHEAWMHDRLFGWLQDRLKDNPVRPIPPNLIFYPCDGVFDEVAFMKSCHKDPVARLLLKSTLANGYDDLVPVAKGLYENGF